jgi:lipopolysaccharide transport system ATP-binding protein
MTMTEPVIKVEDLGKKYAIFREGREIYSTFRDAITNSVRSLGQKLFPSQAESGKSSWEDFWALRDISFEVQQGEVLGIIGPNGAGKTTLLKLLSRITDPTCGRITLNGRVASLLEVGTGFHPELTGRENIFLNGAILGMHRAEIRAKFDEIVAFAEVEKFLDTPVKRYSSGMYMRLAFAVAAHLDPEIMLVDEVLAVGDAAFQRKCLGKMGEVASTGRTIFFVSHNMGAISKLCHRGIVLNRGQIVFQGDKVKAVECYQKMALSLSSSVSLAERTDRRGSGKLRVTSVGLYNENTKEATTSIACSDRIIVQLQYQCNEPRFLGRFRIVFLDSQEITPLVLDTCIDDTIPRHFPDKGTLRVELSGDFALPVGIYSINVWAFVNDELADLVMNAMAITVTEGDFFGSGKLPPQARPQCYVKHQWYLQER